MFFTCRVKSAYSLMILSALQFRSCWCVQSSFYHLMVFDVRCSFSRHLGLLLRPGVWIGQALHASLLTSDGDGLESGCVLERASRHRSAGRLWTEFVRTPKTASKRKDETGKRRNIRASAAGCRCCEWLFRLLLLASCTPCKLQLWGHDSFSYPLFFDYGLRDW